VRRRGEGHTIAKLALLTPTHLWVNQAKGPRDTPEEECAGARLTRDGVGKCIHEVPFLAVTIETHDTDDDAPRGVSDVVQQVVHVNGLAERAELLIGDPPVYSVAMHGDQRANRFIIMRRMMEPFYQSRLVAPPPALMVHSGDSEEWVIDGERLSLGAALEGYMGTDPVGSVERQLLRSSLDEPDTTMWVIDRPRNGLGIVTVTPRGPDRHLAMGVDAKEVEVPGLGGWVFELIDASGQ
jgi:hypothetical protein